MSIAPSVDLSARRPVWEALSTLFLDTDVRIMREDRARVLAGSPYSIETIEAILIDEVYPVCRGNLLSIAGEWNAFDVDWLEDRIMRRLGSPLRALHRINLGRLSVRLSVEWSRTKTAILAERRRARDGTIDIPIG